MADIRYVFLSDLHFGAQNSVLSVLGDDDTVDPTVAGEVMHCLAECLQELVAANETWDKPTLVLGGDILELALASDNVSAMVFERFMELTLSHSERIFDHTVYFVPGNHDHHLWEAARERHYADVVRTLPKDQHLIAPWHATPLFPETEGAPVTAALMTALVQRDEALRDVTVHTVYPNLGLVDETGKRVVLFHHGHYAESMYRLVSTATELMFNRVPSDDIDEWESENFAWVDFFWSTLGRSGAAGVEVNLTYDCLQSPEATEHLVHNLVTGMIERGHHTGFERLSLPFETLIGAVIDRLAHFIVARERRHPEHVLREDTERGLREFVEGPLLRQMLNERNGEAPESTTFVFGHTHKPFVGVRDYAGYGAPVAVANTGGWVVDTLEPMPLHGAGVALFDEHLDGVLLQMYMQHERDDDYAVAVLPISGSSSSALATRIEKVIGENPEPWRAFSTATAKVVRDRQRALGALIQRSESMAAATRRAPRDTAASADRHHGPHHDR
jgi:metallophosphoesterase superfamily enzyme